MTYHLMRSNGVHKPTVLASYPSFDVAVEDAHARLDIAHYEADADHLGCADMITSGGVIYSIEPARRRR